jgi:hypothetical protein
MTILHSVLGSCRTTDTNMFVMTKEIFVSLVH